MNLSARLHINDVVSVLVVLTLEHRQRRLRRYGIADAVLGDAFVGRIVATAARRLNAQYRDAVHLRHRVAALRARHLFAILAPHDRRLRIAARRAEEAGDAADANAEIGRSFYDLRRICGCGEEEMQMENRRIRERERVCVRLAEMASKMLMLLRQNRR